MIKKKDACSPKLDKYRSIRARLLDSSNILDKDRRGMSIVCDNRVSEDLTWPWCMTTTSFRIGSKIWKAKSNCSAIVRRSEKDKIQTHCREYPPRGWVSKILSFQLLLISLTWLKGPMKFVISVPIQVRNQFYDCISADLTSSILLRRTNNHPKICRSNRSPELCFVWTIPKFRLQPDN